MTDAHQKLLSIVTVTYNSVKEIEACLDAVRESGHEGMEIIVIDNMSKDGTVELFHEKYSTDPSISVIFNNENTGFARASNQGVALARGRYVLLLNPDTVAPIEGVLEMIAYLESHPDVGVIGPRIINEDNIVQESYGEELTPWQEIVGKMMYSEYMGALPFMKKWKKSKLSTEQITEVGWIGGACMLTRTALYKAVGGIDEHFFLSHADMIDLCKRVKDAGQRVVLYPAVTILHRGSKSIVNNRDMVLRIAYSGTLYYFKKYYSGATVFLVKCIYIVLSFAKVIIAFPFSLFTPDPYRDIAKAHFKNMIRIITGQIE